MQVWRLRSGSISAQQQHTALVYRLAGHVGKSARALCSHVMQCPQAVSISHVTLCWQAQELEEAELLATSSRQKPRMPSFEDLDSLPMLDAIFHEGAHLL